MTIQLHKDLNEGNIHQITDGTYTNATARTSENAFTSSNIDKVYKQLDDNTYWVVENVSSGIPSWKKLTSSGDIPSNTDSLSEGSTNFYFSEERVRATVLTGLSLVTNAAITATNTVLEALGLLQKQITDLGTSKQSTLVSGTNIKTVNSNSLLGSGDISVGTITTTSTDTLTNKRITARIGSTTSSATPTINTDNVDIYKLTAQAVDITSFTTNLSGTPTDGQLLEIIITGTAARAITWGTSFASSTIILPTTTVTTNTLRTTLQWDDAVSKWICVGVA